MITICLTCGCHEPSNSHGDARQITMQEIERAGAANGIGRLETAERILAEVRRAVDEWKRSVGMGSAPPPPAPPHP